MTLRILPFFLLFILITQVPSTLFAQTEYALQFNGTNGYVSVPHNNNMNVSKVTIELWLYWEESVGTDVDFLVGKSMEQLEIHTGGGSGNFGLRFIPTTGVYLDTQAGVITQNGWFHVAFIYDPTLSLSKCYINGIEKTLTNNGANPTNSAIITSTSPLLLGVRAGDMFYYKGKIDDVRIWDYVRTQEQIANNYLTTLTGNESGLVAYYKMSDASGTALSDNSGNGNNGTLIGGVTWVTSDSPLPVELVSFSGSVSNGIVALRWVTATEVNNYGFEVERRKSDQGENSVKDQWQKVGFVIGSGNSNSEKRYSFQDNISGQGKYQYRLKQVDTDGKYDYSGTIEVVNGSLPSQFALGQNFPNPFNPSTSLRFTLPSPSDVVVKLYTPEGELIGRVFTDAFDAGNHQITLLMKDFDLVSGIYFLEFSAFSGTQSFSKTKKIVFLK